jgi:hypothetical protein
MQVLALVGTNSIRAAVLATLAAGSAALAASPKTAKNGPRTFDEALADVEAYVLSGYGERKIQGERNDLEPVEAALGTAAYDWARGVALVILVDASGSGATAPYCSGARVGEGLFMTNAHCDHGCDFMRFTMGAERDATAANRQTFRCKSLVRKNAALDYALYTAAPEEPSSMPFPPLALAAGPRFDGMSLIVPGHPYRGTKMLDRSSECYVVSAETFLSPSGRQTFSHLCDTEGGSSGSPLLDAQTGRIVGLHWGGEDREANFAIPMDLIIEDLDANLSDDVLADLNVSR